MKAKILKVGIVTDEGVVTGWIFDCLGVVTGIDYTKGLMAGYTIDELRLFARG